ncbi:aldehyde dehydrogenase family protein [Nocardioides sp. dk4132]|uniref:aldehyde dehydrogenase family protein n=1 Tax=unclassified Nocardioides TaxID=2615069 RepID=UPI001294CD71|nr:MULTISPECIES: aldehyde dehydrogenase family protein [unclassified Nocardioides]MQW78032.1 aldehyde dehydrogenase family protein [Nocardioides sp. dk4132]QGA08137.1 aldehyde dehydrogenase family protein [Nocardioides sp. dk884]
MQQVRATYVDGAWAEGGGAELEVGNAADGSVLARFRGAGAPDVDRACAAADAAWPGWAATSVADRAEVLRTTADLVTKRAEELGSVAALEVGTPARMASTVHGHLVAATIRDVASTLESFAFEERVGTSLVLKEPIGVAGAITAWNYPLYQLATKLVPALAAGCTAVLKPSEVAPLTSIAFFEMLAEAGVPAGVANLVVGTGPEAGEALVTDPRVGIVSFTGSTRTGARIAELAAPGITRVTLELGGKSASVVLDDADLEQAVAASLRGCLLNNGQTCAALTRLIVPRARLAEVEQLLLAGVEALVTGDPRDPSTDVGPVASATQHERVLTHLRGALAEGAVLVAGGPEPVPGAPRGGHYVRPTVLRVEPHLRIAREEVFGPVLCVIAVDSEDEAVAVANDTDYGLSGAVWAGDPDRALAVARRMRTGQVAVNGGAFNISAPFGGYKRSGYGREGGRFGLEEYFETKAVQL